MEHRRETDDWKQKRHDTKMHRSEITTLRLSLSIHFEKIIYCDALCYFCNFKNIIELFFFIRVYNFISEKIPNRFKDDVRDLNNSVGRTRSSRLISEYSRVSR